MSSTGLKMGGLEEWTTEQVVEFVKSIKDPLTPADTTRVVEKVEADGVTGKQLVRCMNVTQCQDILGLPIVKAGAVSRRVRKHLPPAKAPRKQAQGEETVPTFERKEVSEEPSHRFEPDKAEPADLDAASLRNVKFVHWSAGGLGSTGVFFADVGTGWVVAKPTGTETAGEIFATLLAKQLGIRCPNIRTLACADQEDVLRAMRFANGKQEHTQRLRNHRIQGLVFMELVKGYPLPACAMKVLAESSGPNLLRHEWGSGGPFIWTNFGNMENIMVQGRVKEDDGQLSIACIDQGTTCITNEKGRASYMERVRDGAHAACVERNVDSKPFKRLRDAILNGTGHDVGSEGCQLLMEGIQSGCAKLHAMLQSKPSILEDLLMQTGHAVSDFGELASGIERLELAFVQETASIICSVYEASGLTQ
ncbi:hypothetical protein PTSG_12729 [Salpingoeca rosetta]|uniref:Uncharacterized protein n=1 Tax=Salpingoeca rosetta (strain ATCC 50818 / BSB-021) TaxID=946362 RepID=F2UJR2_SALR5|nr:uncharacterized protein PTSG_12729 [Salpingoeca rosetta]EGD77361.1 hypothetical protein PTSG_12729 [Salpingoeca rosetta]|eukprot:XP_004990705.1 hypothetical protein PTSG_12729 [Salpingoeca rosetta]